MLLVLLNDAGDAVGAVDTAGAGGGAGGGADDGAGIGAGVAIVTLPILQGKGNGTKLLLSLKNLGFEA